MGLITLTFKEQPYASINTGKLNVVLFQLKRKDADAIAYNAYHVITSTCKDTLPVFKIDI